MNGELMQFLQNTGGTILTPILAFLAVLLGMKYKLNGLKEQLEGVKEQLREIKDWLKKVEKKIDDHILLHIRK